MVDGGQCGVVGGVGRFQLVRKHDTVFSGASVSQSWRLFRRGSGASLNTASPDAVKKPAQFILLLVIVALIAVGASLLTRHFLPAFHRATPEVAHMWIHQQLGITPEQEKMLEPIEHRYAERRMQLTQAVHQANLALADALLADEAASPRVNAEIEKIHDAQGELQMVTIAHVFEMKAVLTPEQWRKLLALTAEALKQETGENH